ETLAAANWSNVNPQRRTNEQDDLIHFEHREYDNRYTSLTYSEYTVRTTTPMPIYYEVQHNKKEENDEHIVITNPDDVLVLPLNNIEPMPIDTEDYRSMILLLPFGTWNLAREQLFYTNSTIQQPQPPNLPDQQLAPGAAAANLMEQLLQSMNNLISAMEATSCKGESAGKVELVDPLNNILDQPTPNEVLLALTLNSRIETLDVSSIEVIYCEKIRKEINNLSIRNLIGIHGQRKYLLGEVESLPIVISKVKIPINIEVTEAKDYTMIVGIDYWDEELGISRKTKKYTSLDKNQQAKVEELMKNNKFLFAEGLTQSGRTKEEIHTITLKEEVEPVKQKLYRVSYIENEFISQKRLQAQDNIQKAQRRQKNYYNYSIRPIEFRIGDQVLLHESAKEKYIGIS
ncbi:38144_t:CDS:2, partial [Gigaspora margarita]